MLTYQQVPGPTIEAAVGEKVTVTLHNDLRDDMGVLRTEHLMAVDECIHGPNTWGKSPRISLHVHGIHSKWQFDGNPIIH